MPKKSDSTIDPKSSPIARGKRLSALRHMTSLTREIFKEKYHVSASTLQSWEAAKAGGLSARGANLLVPLFLQEGIQCTAEWLLHGIGEPPRFLQSNTNNQAHLIGNKAPDAHIHQELLAFRKFNAHSMDFVIQDDGMAYYKPGEYVAGIQRHGEAILDLVGLDCIVHTAENIILFRRIQRHTKDHKYTLICTNLTTSVSSPILYEQQLLLAAPVIWHRKIDSQDQATI